MEQKSFLKKVCSPLFTLCPLPSDHVSVLSSHLDVDETQQIHYDNAAIESLLDRDREGIPVDKTDGGQLLANEYLSSFKVCVYIQVQCLGMCLSLLVHAPCV